MSKNTQPPTDSIKNGRRTKGLDPKTKGEVGGTEQGETKCIETGQNKNTHADVWRTASWAGAWFSLVACSQMQKTEAAG